MPFQPSDCATDYTHMLGCDKMVAIHTSWHDAGVKIDSVDETSPKPRVEQPLRSNDHEAFYYSVESMRYFPRGASD